MSILFPCLFLNRAFRTYLGLNLQATAQSPDGRTPRRGARRIQAFMRALESETDISPEQARSVAAALGMATGAEAIIALFDIAGPSAEEARAVVAETAEAVCDRMLPWTATRPSLGCSSIGLLAEPESR